MSPPAVIAIAIVAVIALTALALAAIYNGLRAALVACDDAWSLIDVQLTRRADLVPNLVAAVGAYADHERSVLEGATEARAAALQQHDPTAANAAAETSLGNSIASVIAVAECYPDLKANANFLQLSSQLTDLENQIAASREIYNGNVASYRTKLQQIPTAWVASWFKFTPRELFALRDSADRLPPSLTSQA